MSKDTFDEQQAALNKSQRAEDRATRDWTAEQERRTATKGVPQPGFSMPKKSQPKSSTGGYTGKKPFDR